MPNEDIGFLMVGYNFPEGEKIIQIEKVVESAEKIFKKAKEIESYVSIIGDGWATTFLPLKEHKIRKKTSK